MSTLISDQTPTMMTVQRPVKINRQSWDNYQHGQINRPRRSEKRAHMQLEIHEDAPVLKKATLQLERDTVLSTIRTSNKRKLTDTPEDAPPLKKARIQLETERNKTMNPPQVKWPALEKAQCPTVWIIGDSYICRGEEIARRSLGTDLGVNAEVSWFGWGGLRWRGLIPFFNQTLQGKTVPDVLVIHCGGNDLGGMNSVHLVTEMKKDLCDLHRRYPQMKIVLSEITPRRQWRSKTHPKMIDASRKWVNSAMADFVLRVEGGVVHHPYIVFNDPRLFLKDKVHLSPLGNEHFLSDISECLKALIQ